MKILIGILLLISSCTSCKNNSADKKNDPKDINEQLTKMNRTMVENESKRIDDFIARHSFKTTMTGTGLRYEIYQHGKGEKPVLKDQAEIKYKVFLLNGTLCYSSDSTGSVKLRLGVGEQVSGLEEGLMLMVPGDKAHLILPAHLGYGMTGDQVKIPPSSPLYFDVELVNIIK
jgi:FKBP-type peptidyl-prolyl cis-trans isomerase FkpA